jgi:phosphate transport system protein
MPREILDNKIRHLFDEIIMLASMIENAILAAVRALKNRDVETARQVYNDDRLINTKRFELENEIIVTIATQQPLMARDLRLIASVLEVVGELERIGDYAKGIAKICVLLGKQPPVKPLIDIPRMADLTVDMLNRAITAFVKSDVNSARTIPPEDDQIDALYTQVYRELVTIMLGNPSTIDRANYLMWATHNLERMADRVTNICERTIYVATGELMEFDVTNEKLTHPE